MSKQYQHQEAASVPLGFVLLAQGPGGVLQAVQSDGSGNLKTSVTGAGSGGTSAVDESAFTAGVSAGTPLMLYDPGSGELVIAQAQSGTRIMQVNAAVTVTPVTSNTSSAPSRQTIGGTAAQILAANGSRKRLMLQNVGTTILYIVLGSATPTTTSFHFALPAGGTTGDGSSPVYLDTMWIGAVQAISSAAGGLIVVTELT